MWLILHLSYLVLMFISYTYLGTLEHVMVAVIGLDWPCTTSRSAIWARLDPD